MPTIKQSMGFKALLAGSAAAIALAVAATGAVGQEQPVKGGKLTVHINRDIGGFDHIKVPQGGMGRFQVLNAVHDKLFEKDADGKIVPKLAVKATAADDFKRWRVELRKGVKFAPHAANPAEELTSEAYVHHWNRLLGSSLAGRFRAQLGSNLQKVVAIDKHTVEFQFGEPNLAFRDVMADGGVYVWFTNAPSFAKKFQEDPNYNRMSAGAGPYMVKEWVPGKGVTLVKNPNYWDPGSQHLDEIFYRITTGPETAAAWNAFAAGDLDVMWSLNGSGLARARKEGDKFNIANGTRGQLHFSINFQSSHAPLEDVRVRRALSHAIDRKAIIRIVGRNSPIFADQSFPPGSPWHCEGIAYPEFNVEKAKALLADFGKPVPKIEIWTLNIPSFRKTIEIIQAMWKKVGVESEIKVGGRGPTGVVFKIVKGETPAWMNPRGPLIHPTVFNMDLHSKHKNNIWRINSPKLDAAIAKVKAARGDAEVKAAHCAFEKAKTEVVAYMPFQYAPAAMMAQKHVGGVRTPNDANLGYHRLWRKK